MSADNFCRCFDAVDRSETADGSTRARANPVRVIDAFVEMLDLALLGSRIPKHRPSQLSPGDV